MLYKFKDHAPQATYQPWDGWVAENATVIGQVQLGRQQRGTAAEVITKKRKGADRIRSPLLA